ncbi:MAG: SOS response-associated peptidase [Propioniciclava sp.]|uniref:SOS response-associated peptidase n=1 Tax=Propioniciclava sp. TaxID=2038686 RepID=UPI0039E226D6
MCGRYASSADPDALVATFIVDEVDEIVPPSFNVAPTDPVPAVVERIDKETDAIVRKLVAPRWGLVPSWSKDARGAARMINARAETVATKPAYAQAFASRRCLLPADGYYEWQTLPGPGSKPVKQPWFIRPVGGGVLAMAGLYEFWKDRSLGAAAPWLVTCTVITTSAIDALGHVHDRMPMMIAPGDWAAWLDPHAHDPADAHALLRTPAADEIETFMVAPLVNSVRNNGPDLVRPLD